MNRPIPTDFVDRTLPCGCCPPFRLCSVGRELLDAEFALKDSGQPAAIRAAAAAYDAHIQTILPLEVVA